MMFAGGISGICAPNGRTALIVENQAVVRINLRSRGLARDQIAMLRLSVTGGANEEYLHNAGHFFSYIARLLLTCSLCQITRSPT